MSGLKALWRELGVNSKLFDFSYNSELAQKVQFSVDRLDSTSYTVIRAQQNETNEAQLLVFHRMGSGCHYIGAIDIETWKHRPPTYRFYPRDPNSAWLAVTVDGGSGTGFSREVVRWYLVQPRSLRFVMGYTAHGHDGPTQIDGLSLMREFDSDVQVGKPDKVIVTVKAKVSGWVRWTAPH